jgi:hypothetical protein
MPEDESAWASPKSMKQTVSMIREISSRGLVPLAKRRGLRHGRETFHDDFLTDNVKRAILRAA